MSCNRAEELSPLGARNRVSFAGVSKQAEPMSAGLEQIIDEPQLAVDIQGPIIVERRVQNRIDTLKTGCIDLEDHFQT